MAITFALRGNSLTARYSTAGSAAATIGSGVVSTVDAGALSGSLITLSSGGAGNHAVFYPGRGNLPTGLAVSVLIRAKWGYTGTPAATKAIFSIGNGGVGGNAFGHLALAHASSTGNINVYQTSDAGVAGIINVSIKNTWSPTSGTYYDHVLTFDGTTGANAVNHWIDGTNVGSLTSAAGWLNPRVLGSQLAIAIGMHTSSGSSLFDIDEFVIWDSVINPTSVALVSGTGSLNGAARTSLVAVSAFDGAAWTALVASKIKLGETQTQAGVVVTGTGAMPVASDVRSGVATGTTTGTCVVPSSSNVRGGTSVDATTGTCIVPVAADVRSGTSVDATTGVLNIPATTDVRKDVTYDNSTKTGVLTGSVIVI